MTLTMENSNGENASNLNDSVNDQLCLRDSSDTNDMAKKTMMARIHQPK